MRTTFNKIESNSDEIIFDSSIEEISDLSTGYPFSARESKTEKNK